MKTRTIFAFSTLLALQPVFFNSLTPPVAFAEDAATTESSSAAGLQYAQDLSSAFEKVADQITPATVTVIASSKPKIRVKGKVPQNNKMYEPYRDFFGEDFFDKLFPDQGEGSEGGRGGGGAQGMGTGVIVDSAGHILTNNHVVEGADEVTVKLPSDKTVKAKVIGTDPRTDLAVIKIIDPKITVKPAKLGNSDSLKIGEWVVAAGNPFGLSNSITAGIVSAKGRSIMGGGQFEDFIQTDAAINPGNSGGPLVNLRGEVIGINTAIFSRSGGYMGIGFAIPINMARSVMESLIGEGKVVRGWLGVGIQNLTDDAAESFGYKGGTEGALVGHVEPGSPAEKAGVAQGDIVTAINSQKITNVNQLRNIVAATRPGEKLTLDLIRNGAAKTVSVKVGELPNDKQESPVQDESAIDLGASFENLTAPLARQLGTKKTEGVLVTSVRPGSTAEKSGLAVRDIIVSLNGSKVKDVTSLNQQLEKANLKKGVRLVVETQGMERFVFIKEE